MEQVILLGEKINLEDFKEFEIVGIISEKKDIEVENIPVYTYACLLNLPENVKLVIVDDNWELKILFEFNELITTLGLRLGKDYIYHSMMGGKINTNVIYRLINYSKEDFYNLMREIIGNRELVIIYGNCQTQVIIDMISSNKEFRQKYVTCVMPRFWVNEDKSEYKMLFDSNILHMARYLFTQEVSVTNRFGYMASTEHIVSQLSKECRIVTIANLYFDGYFPQLKNYGGDIVDWWKGKFPTYGGVTDKEVLKLITMGKGDKEILEEIKSDNYFSSEELRHRVEAELERFQLKEKSIEIKMADFLKENYDKFLLFVTVNHPTRNVFVEFSKRILKKLEIEDRDILYEDNEIPRQIPNLIFAIYPSVLKAFGLHKRKFPFYAKLYRSELSLLEGINAELDELIAENKKKEKNEYNVSTILYFEDYMLIYIRTLRAAIRIA